MQEITRTKIKIFEMKKLSNPYHTNLGDNYQYDRTLEIVKPVIK